MTNEEDVISMLRDLNDKVDQLKKLLTGHWKDGQARRRERTW